MALEIKQSLKLSQQLVMTPQLQQAIKLLQMNRQELAEMVNLELVENPLLEEVAETVENPEGLSETQEARDGGDLDGERETEMPESEGSDVTDGGDALLQQSTQEATHDARKDDIDWDSYLDELNNNQSLPSGSKLNTEELPSFENVLTRSESLEEHLTWQLSMAVLTPEEQRLGALIVGNLNEDGYLQAPLEDLAKEAKMELEDAEEVLKLIQRFDPMGVAARDLAECLMVQAQMLQPRDEVVETMIAKHLPDLERRNLQIIAKSMDMDVADVLGAVAIIKEFEPKPGRCFRSMDDNQYITPDIYIVKNVSGEFVISLNDDGLPKLRVSQYYKNVLAQTARNRQTPDGKAIKGPNVTKDYIQDKLKSAVWLIRSIHNRQKTIYKVTESILKFQKEFFEHGVGYLKPMILRDVASDIGMHESTISRVTTNKFVHTPMGIFELKYFFNSGISSGDGAGDVASEAVKERVRQLIGKEDPQQPLSDQKIVEILKEENIDIARRTVAKYRDMLGLLSSSKRKKVF